MDELTLIAADTFCICASDGQIRKQGGQGLYVRDTRALAELVLRLDGREPLPLSGRPVSPASARFTAWWRSADDAEPDPKLLVERRRVLSASLWEEILLTNHGTTPVRVEVTLQARTDLAYIFDVKHGRFGKRLRGHAIEGGVEFRRGNGQRVNARTAPAPDHVDAATGTLGWSVELQPHMPWRVSVEIGFGERGQAEVTWPTVTWDPTPAVVGDRRAARPRPASMPHIDCSDARVTALAGQAAADIESLLVADPLDPQDHFLAAGSPWFLTLFGRDSLWAAFMALPLDVSLAGQTLRVLARRQGVRVDPETEEQPGKILHEVRHGGMIERSDLPPVYYGSMDATPLFVVLLHEAWRWGLPIAEVEALLPAAERALHWMRAYGDPDGDGFIEYIRSRERGLENQGWKDSVDGIQFADGRLAAPPIALCEVQGYAYDAAVRGAQLLHAFGRPGTEDWLAWATELRDRFRAAFWVDGPDGRYPALALDGDKRQVDVVASNMGHLPMTGILDPVEIAAVARTLADPAMDSGWGVRTMTAASPRFNPLSYHGGSVWPHDTAIAVHSLALAGHTAVATSLLRGLVAAAPYFGYRLPELFGGEQRTQVGMPLPYPAACSPQAWAAGAGLLILRAAIGLHPDVPGGRVVLRPLWPLPWSRLDVHGVHLGTGLLSLTITRAHGVFVRESPPGLDIVVEGAPTTDVDPGPLNP